MQLPATVVPIVSNERPAPGGFRSATGGHPAAFDFDIQPRNAQGPGIYFDNPGGPGHEGQQRPGRGLDRFGSRSRPNSKTKG